MTSKASSTSPEPRYLTPEELRRHGLPADGYERLRTSAAEIPGVLYAGVDNL